MRNDGWTIALDHARRQEVEAARDAVAQVSRAPEPFPAAHDYLLGRCLAEAGAHLDEAIERLQSFLRHNSRNQLAEAVLGLALLRAGRHAEASEIFERRGLPHDETLLAQIMLTMENVRRPWPERLREDWPRWPDQLGPDPRVPVSPLDETDPDIIPLPSPEELDRAQKKELEELIAGIDEEFFYLQRPPSELIREVNAALSAGLHSAEFHLLAGAISEEGGDGVRARVHLATALDMAPDLLHARALLGKVYWRSGWLDLAEDLLRSLPASGPDDYGRFYYLALVHEAKGDRPAALHSMGIALRDFYVDTYELIVERSFRRWVQWVAEQDAVARPVP